MGQFMGFYGKVGSMGDFMGFDGKVGSMGDFTGIHGKTGSTGGVIGCARKAVENLMPEPVIRTLSHSHTGRTAAHDGQDQGQWD